MGVLVQVTASIGTENHTQLNQEKIQTKKTISQKTKRKGSAIRTDCNLKYLRMKACKRHSKPKPKPKPKLMKSFFLLELLI